MSPRKKSKLPFVIGGGVVALAVAAGAALALLGGSGEGDTETSAASTTTVSVATTAALTTSTAQAQTTVPSTAAAPPSVATLATSTVQLLLLDDAGVALCSGSGTIIESNGTIVTNAHVVIQDEFCPFTRIGIAITDGADHPPVLAYDADLLAIDSLLDLAIVRVARTSDGVVVTDPDFHITPIGDSDLVEIGDDIRILGYPSIGGDTITFTNGSVSGFTAQTDVGDRSWIKTDATIAGGNSGGTAVNDAGELIGVPTQASATSDGPIVDCRVITDTNGDGVRDDNDQCVPIGGFLNGIRPINLVLPLLAQAQTATPIPIDSVEAPGPVGNVDISKIIATRSGFSLGIAEVEADTEFVSTATSGITELCSWFNWQGVPEGTGWDAVWLFNGDIVDNYSIFDAVWELGTDGVDNWVCALDEEGMAAGLYEMVWFVDGEIIFAEGIVLTEEPVPIFNVSFVNATEVEICYLTINPAGSIDVGLDELGDEQTILPTQQIDFQIPAGSIVSQAYDCSGNPVSGNLEGIEISSDDVVTMSPG